MAARPVRLKGGLRRQLRADRAAVAALAAILLGTAFLAAAWPRWLNDIDDRAVRYELAQSPEIDDLRASYEGPLRIGGNTLDALERISADLLASFDAPLPELLGPPVISSTPGDYLILTVNEIPRPEDAADLFMTPVLLTTDRPEVRFVDGSAPDEGGPRHAPPGHDIDEEPITVEVALSTVGAEALGLEIGDVVVAVRSSHELQLEITGFYEPTDPTRHTWARHLNLLRDAPIFSGGGDLLQNTAGALVTPESLPSLMAATDTQPATELITSWEFPLDVAAVHAGLVDDLKLAADRAQSAAVVAPSGAPYRVQTSVQEVMERFLRQRTTAHAVLSIGLVGLMISALAVLVLGAQLSSQRRHGTLALARARGASLRQLTTITAVEGLLVAALSVGAGLALAFVVVPARSSVVSWLLVGGLAAAAAIVVAGLTWWQHRRVGAIARRDLAIGGLSPRRLAAEIGLLVLAAVSFATLRQRGFDTGVVGGSADPLLLAVPGLLALATAVVVLRLSPAPIRLLGHLMGNRGGSVSFLGLVRAGRDASGRAVPLVVVLVALSFSVFTAIVLHSVRLEQEVRSWELVGAPVRVDGSAFAVGTDVPRLATAAGVPVDQTFGISVQPTALHGSLMASREKFSLLLLDPTAFQSFVAGRAIDTSALEPLIAAPAGDGTAVPMIVSPGLSAELGDDQTRDMPFLLPGSTPTLTAVGTINSFLGFDPDELWAVGRTTDADLVVDLPYSPTIVLIDAERANPDAVLDAAQVTQPFAQVTSRDRVYEEIAGSPLVAGTELTFQAATAVAALYCALSVILALVVSARRRDRFLSHLRTLGLSSRQVRGLVAWEIVPMTMIAILVGAGVGLALPFAVLPAVDLTPFTGGRNQPPIYTDGGTVAALAVGLLAVVLAAVLAVTSINRRRGLGATLRIGEDL